MARIRRKNYDQLLASVRNRRSDFDGYGNLQKSVLTESFKKPTLPETVKYVYESMEPVGQEYTNKTFEEAARVENQIRAGITAARGVITDVVFEYQGSVPSDTHIKVHSDLDILVIHDRFYYGVPNVAPKIDYEGKPYEELKELRLNAFNRLTSSFPAAEVKNDKPKCIQISGGSLKRKFDVLVCSRFNSQEYVNTRVTHLRAISLYNMSSDTCHEDHPFTHIYEVDKKDTNFYVRGNLRRIVRLLKSLKMDADKKIELSSFMITSIMYHMEDSKFYVSNDKLSQLLVNASLHLDKVLSNENYRLQLKSPNKKENLFVSGDSKVLTEVRKLKNELDVTIADLADDFKDMDAQLDLRRFEKGGVIAEGYSDLNSQYGVLNSASIRYSNIY